MVKTLLNGQSTHALLDSGAGKSVMDLGTYDTLKSPGDIITPLPSNEQLTDASNNEMDILGTALVDVEILGSEKTFLHKFYVLNK